MGSTGLLQRLRVGLRYRVYILHSRESWQAVHTHSHTIRTVVASYSQQFSHYSHTIRTVAYYSHTIRTLTHCSFDQLPLKEGPSKRGERAPGCTSLFPWSPTIRTVALYSHGRTLFAHYSHGRTLFAGFTHYSRHRHTIFAHYSHQFAVLVH